MLPACVSLGKPRLLPTVPRAPEAPRAYVQTPCSEHPPPHPASDALLWVGGKTPAQAGLGPPRPREPPPPTLAAAGSGGEAVREDQRAWPWAWVTTSEKARSALGGQPECPLRLPAGATPEVSPAAARAARLSDGRCSVDGVRGAFRLPSGISDVLLAKLSHHFCFETK